MITIEPPWPPQAGGAIRNAALARAAAARAEVSVLPFGPAISASIPVGISGLAPLCDGSPWVSRDRAVPTRLRLTETAGARLRQVVADCAFDIALVQGAEGSATLDILEAAGIPAIVDMHNIESQLLRQMHLSRAPLGAVVARLRHGRRWRRAEALDAALSHRAAETWLCSDLDAVRLRQIGGAEARVIPNPVPDETLFDLPITPDRYAAPKLLYAGHLRYGPNVGAVQRLVETILPALGPKGRLTLAGLSPHRHVVGAASAPEVTLISDPPEMRPILAAHGLTVLPIREGGGTRIKVLESMAAGIAVISTERAVEGLGLVPGRHYVNAETPRALADAVRAANADPRATAAMAREARAHVADRHGMDAIRRDVGRALGEVAERFAIRRD